MVDRRLGRVAIVVIVPAWMLGDGEYAGLGVGEPVTTGLALAVTEAAVAPPAAPALQQRTDHPGFTTLRARVECPHDDDDVRVGTVLRAGPWTVAPFAAAPLRPGEDVVASGWLTAEPYLWAAGSPLARAVPDGRQEWRVGRLRRVVDGGAPQEIPRLPDEAAVDPDAAYLMDLDPLG